MRHRAWLYPLPLSSRSAKAGSQRACHTVNRGRGPVRSQHRLGQIIVHRQQGRST